MSKRAERRKVEVAAAALEVTRQHAYAAARSLALDIGAGHDTGSAAYGSGIVLLPGEAVWAEQVPADWVVQETYTWPDGTSRKQWDRHGVRPWLVTDRRLASRQPDGTLSQVNWADVAGCRVDLVDELVIFNSVTGWQGALAGPAAAVIAVAAIAGVYGVQALAEHPGLAALRTQPAGHDSGQSGKARVLPAASQRGR